MKRNNMINVIKAYSITVLMVFISSTNLYAENFCSSLFSQKTSKGSLFSNIVIQLSKVPGVNKIPKISDTAHIQKMINSQQNHSPEDAYPFGPEFTLTNPKLIAEGNQNPTNYNLSSNPIKAQALHEFWDLVKEKCKGYPGCTYRNSTDKHGDALEVRFEDGFYFTIGNDSCVIEINARPETINGFKKASHYIEEFVFVLGKQMGLEPHIKVGQGHIHISRLAFLENGFLLRNFFVDFQNRPEIIYGALGNHLFNSPPLSAQKREQRVELNDFLEELDQRGSYTIEEFVNGIHQRVYTSTIAAEWGRPEFYQAFNMTRLLLALEKATLEIRSLRPQRSVREYELLTKLFSAWIEHLRKIDKPIKYNMSHRYEFTNIEIVDGFYKLIQKLELSWSEYKELLPPHLVSITPSALASKKSKPSTRRFKNQ